MTSKIVTLPSSVWHTYSGGLNFSGLDKDDVYVSILNREQTDIIKKFEASNEINILFKSKIAVNTSPNHGSHPRNTLYVFEVK